jgi:hypothetical protein
LTDELKRFSIQNQLAQQANNWSTTLRS